MSSSNLHDVPKQYKPNENDSSLVYAYLFDVNVEPVCTMFWAKSCYITYNRTAHDLAMIVRSSQSVESRNVVFVERSTIRIQYYFYETTNKTGLLQEALNFLVWLIETVSK